MCDYDLFELFNALSETFSSCGPTAFLDVLRGYDPALPKSLPDGPEIPRFALTRSHIERCRDFSGPRNTASTGSEPLEYRLLRYGARAAVLVIGETPRMLDLGRKARHAGYASLVSPFTYLRFPDRSKANYSNRLQNLGPRQGCEGVTALLIARTAEAVTIAWASHVFRWDALLGYALSYPECCVDAYCKRWRFAQQHLHGDLTEMILEESSGSPFPWQTNVLSRYVWNIPLQHFPCNLHCSASRELSDRSFAAMQEHDDGKVALYRNVMCMPYVFTNTLGVFAFPDADVQIGTVDWTMTYDPARLASSDPHSPLGTFLRNSNLIVGERDRGVLRLAEGKGYLAQFADIP